MDVEMIHKTKKIPPADKAVVEFINYYCIFDQIDVLMAQE